VQDREHRDAAMLDLKLLEAAVDGDVWVKDNLDKVLCKI